MTVTNEDIQPGALLCIATGKWILRQILQAGDRQWVLFNRTVITTTDEPVIVIARTDPTFEFYNMKHAMYVVTTSTMGWTWTT
jgi:hypothetical protein